MRKHEMAPSTSRSAWLISRKFGFGSTQELAESLPENAKVVDFGAGRSRFGYVVTEKRPDIQWLSVDLRFGDMRRARRLQAKSSGNLQHIAADVLNPPFQPHSFDRVYSTALVPHLLLDSAIGRQGIHAMANLMNEEGEMILSGFSKLPRHNAVHISAEEYNANPDEVVEAPAGKLALNAVIAGIQSGGNVIGHYTGSHFLKRNLP